MDFRRERSSVFDIEDDIDDIYNLQLLDYFDRRSRLVHSSRILDLDVMDEFDFRSRYRFNKATVESIVEILAPKLEPSRNQVGAVSAAEKICSALRFYAEGSFQTTIGDLGQISQPSASRAISSVSNCLADLSNDFIKIPSLREMVEISKEFYGYSGFPGVLGTMDCSHIPIVSPGGDYAEQFRCRKGFFSLNTQTMSDHRLKIRNIVARWPGGAHDSTIFDSSRLRAVLEANVPADLHVLGDSGYPLRHYLLTPFLSPQNNNESRYNDAHIRTRNSVERQYGVWKRRFACLSHKLRTSLPNSQTIIVAAAVLHNIAVELGDFYESEAADPDPPEVYLGTGSIAGLAKRGSIVQQYFTA